MGSFQRFSAALAISTAIGTSAAQAQWDFISYGTEYFPHPTAFARTSDPGTYLNIACYTDRRDLTIFLDMDTSAPLTDNKPAVLVISVDGTNFSIPATYVSSEAVVYGSPGDSLVAALMKGRAATVVSEELGRFSVSLSGSSNAIGQVLASCSAGGRSTGGGASAADGQAFAALQAALVAELTAECRATGGTVEFAEGAFARSGQDIIVNFHHITCPGAFGVLAQLGVGNCGAAQCLQRVYSLRNGRYVETRSYWQ